MTFKQPSKGVQSRWGIKAGEWIKAGGGIVSGLFIVCRRALTFKFSLFAGTATWKKVNPQDCQILAASVGPGEVKHGIVKIQETR